MRNAIDIDNTGLIARFQLHLRKLGETREPLALVWLGILCISALCIGALIVEWANISLVLRELYPSTSDGSGAGDTTGTVGFASIAAIFLGEVLLDKASEHWSEAAKRRLDKLGVCALILLVVCAMILLPTSIWEGNDQSEAGNGQAFTLANLALSGVLAALFPMSLLTNCILFARLKPLLSRVEGATQVHTRLQSGRRLLADYQGAQSAFRAAEQQQASIPTAQQIAEQSAARMAAEIGAVKGALNRVLMLRLAVAEAGPDTRLVATDDEPMNHMPIDAIRAHIEYLDGFTPNTIKQILA